MSGQLSQFHGDPVTFGTTLRAACYLFDIWVLVGFLSPALRGPRLVKHLTFLGLSIPSYFGGFLI